METKQSVSTGIRYYLRVLLAIIATLTLAYFLIYYFEIKISNTTISSIISIQHIQHSQENQDTNSNFTIKIIGVQEIYIDPTKSGILYMQNKKLMITILLATRRANEIASKRIQLRINKDNTEMSTFDNVKILRERIYANQFYSSYVLFYDLDNRVCSNVNNKSGCNSLKTGQLSYQFIINGEASSAFPINIIAADHMTQETNKTARLIKCIWKPPNLINFEYILKLIIDSNYDSIYVCLFRKDHFLKKIFKKYESIKT